MKNSRNSLRNKIKEKIKFYKEQNLEIKKEINIENTKTGERKIKVKAKV